MVRKLLELNGVAILCVLLFHATGWGFIAMFAWTNRYSPVTAPSYDQVGSLSYFVLRAIEQFVVFSIPAFLFVSGFFVAAATGRDRSSLGWNIVNARLIKLLIPYLLWSGLYFAFLYLQGRKYSALGYVVMLLTGSTNEVYYYVPLLAQMYLLAPFLVSMAKARWLRLLLITGSIQLSVQLLYYPALLGINIPALQPFVDVVPKWFFATRIFWFSLGIVAGFHIQTLRCHLVNKKRLLLVLALVLVPLGMLEWELIFQASGQPWLGHRETLIDTLYAAAVIGCFIAFTDVELPGSTKLHRLATMSFGIYLIHPLVMEVSARSMYHFAPSLLSRQIILVLLLFGLGLMLPLLLIMLVDRSPARAYHRYFFG